MIVRWIVILTAAVTVLCAIAVPTSAQITTGTISGTVKDAHGAIVPGAAVTLVSETRGTKTAGVFTNANGDFVFVNVSPDRYTVQIAMPGFKTLEHSGIAVTAGDRFDLGDGLQHRAIGEAAATDIVDLARARSIEEAPERVHQIEGMDVVADLLAVVAEDRVRLAADRAFDEIGEEAMQLRAGMAGPGQAAAAEAGRAHAEIAAIFLHQHVGCDLRRAEQAVQGLIDRHVLTNAPAVRVVRRDLPPRF